MSRLSTYHADYGFETASRHVLARSRIAREALRRRNAAAREVHEYNHAAGARRQLIEQRLVFCRELVQERRLYFPHQLDLQGRAYPVPQVFHPQADDLGRALLEFARGKPLGQDGVHWLAVHLTTNYGRGVEKATFEERHQWVTNHKSQIRDSARAPLDGTRLWMNAEKPWCFLAACLEWEGFLEVGTRFVSQLPVVMDGTCNAWQHFSALGGDAIAGQLTNILPGGRPEDIYGTVAVLLKRRIESDALKGKREARAWRGRITRDTVKRAAMTTPYGSTGWGQARQLVGRDFTEGMTDEWAHASYLVNLIDVAIRRLVRPADRITRWLQHVAEEVGGGHHGIVWTAPTGFPVVHEYWKQVARTIKAGRFSLRVYEKLTPPRIDRRRQAQAIAANYVHSLDAAHMMRTVRALCREGLQDFQMIHDCYGVHACDVDKMNMILRREFWRIYQTRPLDTFIAEVRAANPGLHLRAAPKPVDPRMVKAVLQSKYFFS